MKRVMAAIGAGMVALPALLAEAAPTAIDFEKEVWPILEAQCLSCHGPKQHYANLRVDSPEQIRRGGELGEVLVPGDPDKSSLYVRTILPRDDLDYMPVDAEPLSADEKETLRRWIAEGAEYGGWTGEDE